MTQKTFTFVFDDESPRKVTFDYSSDATEELNVTVEDEIPVLYANKKGLLTLAKLFVRLAHGDYAAGFHVHVSKDFDADKSETLRVVVAEDSNPGNRGRTVDP